MVPYRCFIVRLASLCPVHAAITATGTFEMSIRVAQVCRAACSLMCRTLPALTVSLQWRNNAWGWYGCPTSFGTEYCRGL